MVSTNYIYKYDSCAKAAKAGDLEELKRMHLAGFPINDPDLTFQAAGYGHLDCLQYAYENGCPMIDSWVTTTAAWLGSYDCLRYAYENGCPLDLHNITMQNCSVECLKQCFLLYENPQTFWNTDFYCSDLVDKIDLDDKVWRQLFTLDLQKHPVLQEKVEMTKKEIQETKQIVELSLSNKLPTDVITYCIHPYF